MIFDCLNCKKEVNCEEPFGDNVVCPHCQTVHTTEYDEGYDSETGEEWGGSLVTGVITLD